MTNILVAISFFFFEGVDLQKYRLFGYGKGADIESSASKT